MLIEYFVLLICVLYGIEAQYDIGDVCVVNEEEGLPGVCEIINECEYARLLVYRDQKHPPLCGWEGNNMIVCCPKNLLHGTGVFRKYFQGSEDGVLRSKHMTCRYNGYLPMTCCPNLDKKIQYSDPKECPPLPRVTAPLFTNSAHEIAWKKCVENQRYVDICEQDEQDLTVYRRNLVCNLQKNTPRITGDLEAGDSEFPHMAVLGCNNGISTEDVDIVWVGGGSLISDRYILTAGHVLVHITHGRLQYALLGVQNKTELEKGELYNIINLIPHKLYTTHNKHDDIALVKLDRPVRFSEFIRPICLPVPGLAYGEMRVISGWGNTGPHAGTSKILKKAYIAELDSTECERDLSLKDFVWNNKTMICARGHKTRDGQYADSCQGDSGGPLMSIVTNRDIQCNYVLNGVVSWGPNCGGGAAGAYTRVSAYIDWIVSNVWPEELSQKTSSSNDDNTFLSENWNL